MSKFDEIRDKLKEFVPVMDGLSRARNPFELRYFVIGKHDDRVQQYKQGVVEMDIKYRTVIDGLRNLKLKQLEREELEEKIIKEPKDRKEERENAKTYLELEKHDDEVKQLQIGITGAAKEVFDFLYIIENEYPDLIEKTEEELLETETEYWKSRFAKQCSIDLLTYGRLGEGNRSSLAMMPRETQEQVLELAAMRTEETKMIESNVAKKVQLRLAASFPEKTHYIAPPDYAPLKLLKDAPDGYPENKIVKIDRAEIMLATLHRPGDKVWLSENFVIPTGKNYVKHWLECPDGQSIGEYRNRLVKDALSLGCTHIFFVDDDLVVSEDALLKLYAHKLPVVGFWYPKKTAVPESATMISEPGTPSMRPVPDDSTGVIEVDWSLSAGGTLYDMEVFKKLPYPWFLSTDHGTEDSYFCARLREAGIKAYLDCDIKAEHVDKSNGDAYRIGGIERGKYKDRVCK